ncbi:MAG: polysaccharide biosynthesis/export family protein [Pseudomonadota bacterium]
MRGRARHFGQTALRIAMAWLVVALAVGCGCGRETAKLARTTPRPQRVEYRIGVEDVVEVVVWREPQLSVAVPVRPDGRLTVPLAGDLAAAGRTAAELEKEIAARLEKNLNSPAVTVIVKEINAARVFLLGEVARPGAYPLRGSLTALQALAVAGGLTEFARRNHIVILRTNADGQVIRLPFDYQAAVAGRNWFGLEPGDTVVVP